MTTRKRSGAKSLPIYWSDRAKADLVDIGDFIARDNPVAAQKWVEKLIFAIEQAADMPMSGRMVPEFQRADLREIIQGNYRIVYYTSEENIYVLTVFEGHRRFPKISVP
ncbi:MAG: type II toxin-antitoxin system RelE/ParE family toxin [Proteobacteria bacterium]|nr:type II toxin-antitoxin system RelE/ParE family toxin [Pseudomonadota bacterium]